MSAFLRPFVYPAAAKVITMNAEYLKKKTQKLRDVIEPLMKLAESGMITVELQWRDIPGRYLFTEEGLQQYPHLEHAFAEFSIELTGGETPLLRKLKREMGEE